jgi:hypothetical protein
MKDFFISYNSADLKWAEWIAWQLEEANFQTILQAWDFRPGCNFVLAMDNATNESERTIVILSPDYLNSVFVRPEWSAAFVNDPASEKSRLLPVRVRKCELKGLLKPISYIDLVDLDEDDAKRELIDGIKSMRAKPLSPPCFPNQRSIREQPIFPSGDEEGTVYSIANLEPCEQGKETSLKELYYEDVKDSLPTSELKLTSMYMYFKLTKQEVRWTNIGNEIITRLVKTCEPPTLQINISVTREFSTAKSLLSLLQRTGVSDIKEFDELLKDASKWGNKLIEKLYIAFLEGLLNRMDFGSAEYYFSPYHIMMVFVLYAKKDIVEKNPAIMKNLLIPFDRNMLLKIIKR